MRYNICFTIKLKKEIVEKLRGNDFEGIKDYLEKKGVVYLVPDLISLGIRHVITIHPHSPAIVNTFYTTAVRRVYSYKHGRMVLLSVAYVPEKVLPMYLRDVNGTHYVVYDYDRFRWDLGAFYQLQDNVLPLFLSKKQIRCDSYIPVAGASDEEVAEVFTKIQHGDASVEDSGFVKYRTFIPFLKVSRFPIKFFILETDEPENIQEFLMKFPYTIYAGSTANSVVFVTQATAWIESEILQYLSEKYNVFSVSRYDVRDKVMGVRIVKLEKSLGEEGSFVYIPRLETIYASNKRVVAP